MLVKESDLIEKYGDPFIFDDFEVKGKSTLEIKARLRAFDFDYDGLFIDDRIDSKLCFIRVNSIEEGIKDNLCDILNVYDVKIGRLCDKEHGWDLEGRGWFYFKV